jgi:hypothetical protein
LTSKFPIKSFKVGELDCKEGTIRWTTLVLVREFFESWSWTESALIGSSLIAYKTNTNIKNIIVSV